MAKRSKREEAIRRNPNQVRADDLDSVLRANGFLRDEGKGSHAIYRHREIADRVTVSAHSGMVKPYQVRQAIDALDKVQAKEN